MKFIFYALTALFLMLQPLRAQENDGYTSQPLQEYFDEANPNYNKSIIYIFFNNQPCYACAQTISMVEQVYNQNFINQYNMFLINYENDQENDFIDTYNLHEPLAVVLVKINDGASFGYKKLTNLPDMISDPVSFDEYFVEQVNSFLGNQ